MSVPEEIFFPKAYVPFFIGGGMSKKHRSGDAPSGSRVSHGGSETITTQRSTRDCQKGRLTAPVTTTMNSPAQQVAQVVPSTPESASHRVLQGQRASHLPPSPFLYPDTRERRVSHARTRQRCRSTSLHYLNSRLHPPIGAFSCLKS